MTKTSLLIILSLLFSVGGSKQTEENVCEFYLYKKNKKIKYEKKFLTKENLSDNKTFFRYESIHEKGKHLEYEFEFNYSQFDSIQMKIKDKVIELNLLKRYFIEIEDSLNVIYVYYQDKADIDGGHIYYISPTYGIIFIKSETWPYFKKLNKLSEIQKKENQSKFKLDLIFDYMFAKCNNGQ